MPLLLGLTFSSALAAPPTYKWTGGETARFYLETEIYWSQGLKAAARANTETRIRNLVIKAETECKVFPRGKQVELECGLHWIDLGGTPVADRQEKVETVLADWEDFTKPVEIILLIGPDGRLKEFDVNKLPSNNIREGQLGEQMRAFLRSAFAPMDVVLTTDDKDWIRGWERKDLGYMFQLPVADGTAGAGTYKTRHTEDRLGLALLSTEGRATVAPSSAIEESANGGLIDLRVGGEAWFDPATGQLLYSGFTTDGRKVASSSTSSNDQFIAQNSGIQRIAAFDPAHAPPISPVAQRVAKVDKPPAALPEGVALVPFLDLGMQPLFIVGYPQVAQPYDLPTSQVRARVVVDADGVPQQFQAYQGYELLFEHVERGLKDARFPKRSGPYAIDLDVEVRAR